MNLIFSPVYEGTDVLVCYASQTGTAANLAKQSGEIIQGQGKTVTVSSLSSLQPADFDRYPQVLMIVSTCGEGDIPDDGIAFYNQLQTQPALNTRVSLLALGDKSYKQYCIAGRLFHDELLRIGVAVDEDPILVDGNPVKQWQQWLEEQTDITVEDTAAFETEKDLTLKLVENTALHQGDNGGNQAHRLVFKIDAEEAFQYQVGDLIGITPPGEKRERLYSIASGPSVKENHVELCVGILSYQEKGETRYGKCSRYLTSELNKGEPIAAKWKSGGGLALPAADQPAIMIATGAGIAPMMCLMQERVCQKHTADNWLLFGNRKSSEDFYYQQDLETLEKNGSLTYLDTAFSRDSEEKVYVQDVLKTQAPRLAQWLLEDKATLYVCGRPGLKPAILDVTREALAAHLNDATQAEETLAELQASERIVFELF
ncbi:flavodoxin domain-containing protein [Sansalvadorimonas verongulae]|uniref:flavodoxin domain-containing protein n=1 Tax=Sansalvadorimonas verongulae TaxID=2172824 RepID=UPI0018AD2CE7|nr:flavodoxin domain-containing protein [Sansalvadorimonas verongulae]